MDFRNGRYMSKRRSLGTFKSDEDLKGDLDVFFYRVWRKGGRKGSFLFRRGNRPCDKMRCSSSAGERRKRKDRRQDL